MKYYETLSEVAESGKSHITNSNYSGYNYLPYGFCQKLTPKWSKERYIASKKNAIYRAKKQGRTLVKLCFTAEYMKHFDEICNFLKRNGYHYTVKGSYKQYEQIVNVRIDKE